MNGRRKRGREGEKKRNKQCPLHSTRVPHCETASNLPYVQMEKRSNVQILKKSHGKRKINVLPASSCWSKDPVAVSVSDPLLHRNTSHCIKTRCSRIPVALRTSGFVGFSRKTLLLLRKARRLIFKRGSSFLPSSLHRLHQGENWTGNRRPSNSTAKQQGGGVRARTADTHTTPPAALRRKSGISGKYLEKI